MRPRVMLFGVTQMNLSGAETLFLHWLPDECFFSICSRQHYFWCNQSPDMTLNFLFGTSVKRFEHDFPKNLSLLSEDAKSAWGTTDTIIFEHTIATIFFPFQSPENVSYLKHALNSSHSGSLKYRLGLITGRFGASHPLKACIECMAADRLSHGVTYWHLSHQLPGVNICPKHDCMLLESKENRQWSRRGKWVLPDEADLLVPNQAPLNPSTLTALKTLSVAALVLAKLGKTIQFDPCTVSQVYREAIFNRGNSKKAGEAAAESFANHCKKIQPYPPFSSLPRSRRCAIRFISQMTRKPRGHCHPLKHLTLISWLFGSMESFADAYEKFASLKENTGADYSQSLIVTQKIYEQFSKSEKTTGIPRPKKVFGDMKGKILTALLSGTNKKEVCSNFKISVSTVNRLLHLNPAAKQQIANKNKLTALEEHRNIWTSVVEQTPNVTVNQIRSSAPSLYAWLYRNDRDWLFSKTNSLPSGRLGNHVVVDWNARDENLCALIIKTVPMPATSNKKIFKSDLYQLVPNLFTSLEKSSRYQKTRRLISEITK